MMKHSFRKSRDQSDIVVSRVFEDFTSNEFVQIHQSKWWQQHVLYQGSDCDVTSQLVTRFADISSNSYRSH